jgi:hypothetical protein
VPRTKRGPGADCAPRVGDVPGLGWLVMVDWSANSTPKLGQNSIWVADGDINSGDAPGTIRARNYATRQQAMGGIVMLIDDVLAKNLRVLVGFDFSFGYPFGFARYFRGQGRPWERIWQYMGANVIDSERNANNRFDVASDINAGANVAFYWGSPVWRPALAPTLKGPPPWLAPNPLAVYRRTELAARAQAQKPIKSGWQVGNGISVGSQVIMGLPYLQGLRKRYGQTLAVWPQETGFVDNLFAARPGTAVVLAEVWPTALAPSYAGGVRDEEQVRSVVQRCSQELRSSNGVSAWFNPASARGLEPSAAASLVNEEGWILGVL